MNRCEGKWRPEIVTPGYIQDLRCQLERLPFKEADISGPVKQVTWFAAFHLPSFDSVLVKHMVKHWLGVPNAARVSLAFEDLRVSFRSGGLHSSAITHASEEGLIGQIVFIKIS